MTNQKKVLTELVLSERTNFQRYVRRKVSDISEMDAEDIVGDVVFNLFNKVDIENQVESILAYAYRAVSNRIVDFLRQRKTSVAFERIDGQTGLALSEIIPDSTPGIERQMQNEEINRRLHAALLELDAKHREVWIATEIEDRSFKELSVEWNEPVGTLLSRKSRATTLLKKKLKNLT